MKKTIKKTPYQIKKRGEDAQRVMRAEVDMAVGEAKKEIPLNMKNRPCFNYLNYM